MKAQTDQQRDAIAARGNVLVAAGAGTGKTSTVAARCVQLVIEERCRLDEILMVTFTEAAAAEMRERIRAALRERVTAGPPDSDTAIRLAEEIALLDTAPISTLHSFCLDLVRRNFHALGLDPQFTVLDEQQTKPLVHSVLAALFERHYAGSANVRDLVSLYGNGSDDPIRRLVVNIHRHTQALASPEQWFEKQIASFSAPSPAGWQAVFVEGVVEWARLWRETVEPFAQGSANVRLCAQALDALSARPGFDTAAETVAAIVEAHEMKWDKLKKDFRDPIKPFFIEAEFLSEQARAGVPQSGMAQDWSWTREPMLTLLQLAREFGGEFARAKRELGGIDFADQEQLALRLLYGDNGLPTPMALACRERFRFVFVDECQDINTAQDAILRAVSREGAGANRFLVGDVKQSIYRFRLADPRIFQDYETRWKQPGTDGRCKPLTENFRSREALLNFINPLFRTLMRPVIGGLDYDAESELRFGNAAERADLSLAVKIPPEDISPRVELHVITRDGDGEIAEDAPEAGTKLNELPDLQTTEREAQLVALRLKSLKESGHRIWDRENAKLRPAEYSDMVVLMRGVAGRAEIFAKEFHQVGVPLHAERGGFLDAIEVTDLLNLLRLLDNPLQDVPLLAVLRSPLAGFSADELAQVRLAEPHGLLWFALRKAGATRNREAGGAALFNKVDWFLKHWEAWRELIRHSSLTHCIETALAQTRYEALLLAGERGAAQVANVRRFAELARRFDPYQREGLFRFLQFITEQEEAEVRHEPASVNPENAVRLMTIHASKGLEFPVVVVAGLGGKFNTRELSNDILLNEDLGLCPKVLPPETRRRYPSIAHWVAAQRDRRALLGEEMRLLYVALTRARDTLILTGTAARKDETERWREPTPVNDYALVKAASQLDWLRLWFAQRVRPGQWQDGRQGANDLLYWNFHDPHDAGFALPGREATETHGGVRPPTAEELARLKQLLAASYEHIAATSEPAKTSVSVLRRRTVEASEEAAPAFKFQRAAPRSGVHGARTAKLSAAEIGTAHHTFLQFVSLDRTISELDLRNESTRMLEAGLLSVEEAVALDFRALAGFWQSEPGRRVREQPARAVNREMPFTARMTAADLRAVELPPQNPGLANDEFVVIQGVVDLAVVLPGEIWLLDFKTDEFEPAELDAKRKQYGPQLKIYALALARIYRRPVTECWLHFLSCGKTERVAP